MQFLYPIGFLALAGLIIPLIIHLWNIKQGKTLKIGSIALLGESAKASSKSFRINDWFLFALRCLLLILLTFTLALPFIKKNLSHQLSGWILVEKSKFPQVYKDNRNFIDSLSKLGFEIHNFNVGFAPINIEDTANIVGVVKVLSLSQTSLLNQLNDVIPKGNIVYLFSDRRIINFEDRLPQVSYQLKWKALSKSDTLRSWITDYAGKKYEGKSNPSNTTYTAIASSDSTPIKIAIYEHAGNADKKYLIAALNAIESFSGRRIEINSAGKADIGFWLTDDVVSSGFKAAIIPNGVLFQYEKGKIINEQSFINIDGKSISSHKRIDSKNNLEKIWTDGFGRPILSKEKLNNINIFHFYSRLNPQWNQLVWNEVFVKALMPLVIRDEHNEKFGFEDQVNDQRQLAKNQIETTPIVKNSKISSTTASKPIELGFWIAAFVVLALERILSFSKKNENHAKN